MSLPPGVRKIRASETFLTDLGTRTEDGYRIHAEWGEPDESGYYTPVFRVDHDDRLNVIDHAPDFGSDS